MIDLEYIEFRCLQVTQPIGTFYIGVLEFNKVLQVAYADVRRIEQREIEEVLGIQRELDKSRVKVLQQYVRTVDASFPTSVILAVDKEDEDGVQNAVYDETTGVMRLRKKVNLAKIIDGQHRIAGLINYDGSFELNVTLFVDMDVEDQALLFATINLNQTKVNKSLAYDLYEFALKRSPQKSCHNIAKLLNSEPGSPFKGRIKILGKATGKPYENLTQASMVERLIIYISENPTVDRDLIKRGKRLERASAASEKHNLLIFRNMFIDDRDEQIGLVLWNYFGAVAARWPNAWNADTAGLVLNRTTGFASFMRFLPLAYLSVAKPGEVPKQERFFEIFRKVNLRDEDFNRDRFLPGSSGEKQLFETLRTQTKI